MMSITLALFSWDLSPLLLFPQEPEENGGVLRFSLIHLPKFEEGMFANTPESPISSHLSQQSDDSSQIHSELGEPDFTTRRFPLKRKKILGWESDPGRPYSEFPI